MEVEQFLQFLYQIIVGGLIIYVGLGVLSLLFIGAVIYFIVKNRR